MAVSAPSLRAAILVLRIIKLGLLAASLATIATARIHYDAGFYRGRGVLLQPYNLTFEDIYTYRYVFSVAAVGCAYTLLLIPLAALAVVQGKRIGGTSAARFFIFTDVVFCVLYATGGAAGLGYVVDYQRLYGKYFDSVKRKFYLSVDASCGLLLAAAICTVVMIMISVYSK